MKKGNGTSWGKFWAGAVSFVLVGAVTLGVIGWRTNGFTDWTFGFGTTVERPDDINKPNDTGDDNVTVEGKESGLQVTPIPQENENIRITTSRLNENAYSETSFAITATVKPSEATNTQIEWTVSWQNAGSAFASGKEVTDYVTVTPTNDGANTARVDCKAAFGERIIVKATSRDNESKSANCVCDYRKKLIGVTTELKNENGFGGVLSENKEEKTILKIYRVSSETLNYKLSVTLEESEGTINNTYDYNLYIYGAPKLQEIINSRGDIYGSTPQIKTESNSLISDNLCSKENPVGVFTKSFFLDYVVYMDLDWYEDDYASACNLLISNLSKDCGTEAVVEATLNLEYNGQMIVKRYPCGLDFNSIKIAVDDVELDNDHWEF